MTEGATFAQVAPAIGILFGMGVAGIALGAALFRWE